MIRTSHPPGIAFSTVPKAWPGCTMVCLGDGPSLTQEDVDYVRSRRDADENIRVMAMNHNLTMAPWADVLWSYHTSGLMRDTLPKVPDYRGMIFSAEPVKTTWPIIEYTGAEGLELDPRGLRHGNGSGYSALNLAMHLGATRIVLLGYDCCDGPDRRFCVAKSPDSKDRRGYNYALWISRFVTIAGPLREAGVTVLNATRRTALEMFKRISLEEALP